MYFDIESIEQYRNQRRKKPIDETDLAPPHRAECTHWPSDRLTRYRQ